MRKLALFSRYRLYRGRGEFSPADFFLGGITGVWYDPSDVLLNWRTNLLTYSQEFDNAAWTKSNSSIQTNLLTYSVLVGAVAGTPGTAPTGWSFGVAGGTTAVNASSISLSATTGNRHFISNPVSLSANTTYTVSLNVNAVSGSPSDAVVFVLVTTGSIASGTILLLVSDGTGRKTLTFTTGGTATTISLRIGPGCSGAVTSNGAIDFDSPQLVQGSVAGDYRATTASALPILYTDPNGGLTAQSLTLTSGGGTSQFFAPPAATSAPLTSSIWIRADVPVTVAFGFYDTGVGDVINVNVTTSWQRVTHTRVAGLTGADRRACWIYKGSAGGTTVQIWGAQLELGSTATAYQAITTPEQTYLLYDPQPVLYQDAAGTTPVFAVEQPVGLMMDKSQSQSWVDVTGAVWTRTAGDGVLSVSGDTITVTGATTYTQITRTAGNIPLVPGLASMVVRADWTTATGVSVWVRGAPFALSNGVTQTITLALNNSNLERLDVGTGTVTFTISRFQYWRGNHAVQSTNTAFRPTLKARYNLLTYSEQFDNAAWSKGGLNISGTPAWVNVTLAPDGTTTADFLIPQATTANHSINSVASAAGAGVNTFSVYAKAGGYNYLQMLYGSGTDYANFNLTGAGSVSQNSGGAPTIVAVGNGWYRCTITSTLAGPSTVYLQPVPTGTETRYATYLGDNASGVYIWGAQLVTPADNDLIEGQYQRVAAATDYNTDPALFPVYLDFDGSNDFMVSNSINFTSTDKVTVWAGVGKDTDASSGVLTELSVNYNTNNGSFGVFTSDSTITNLANYSFALRGTVATGYSNTSYVAPCYNVLSCLYDINGADTASEVYPQVDGTVPFVTSFGGANAGTGNFGTYPLYLGSRSGASLYFNGKLFGLIVRGAASTSTEIYQGELWMAGKEDLTLYPDAAFNPLSLFAGGAPGAWYKPSDFYNYMSQLGPELVTNGDFSAGTTGWSLSAGTVSGGALNISSGAVYPQIASQTLTLTAGNRYKISITVSRTSGDFFVGLVGSYGAAISTGYNISSSGSFSLILAAQSGANGIYFIGGGAGANLSIDDISVQALTGTFSMYQEAAGSTPVTAVEQSVGLILDQSKGLTIGPERVGATWLGLDATWSQSGSTLIAVNGTNFTIYQPIVPAGSFYKVTFEIFDYVSGTLNIRLGNAGAIGAAVNFNANGTYTINAPAAGDGNFYWMGNNTFTGKIRNISVKQIPGNHAFQSTPANCPVLRARYNLLTYSEQFNNVAWVGNAAVTPNIAMSPIGDMTADLFNTAPGQAYLMQQTTGLLAATYIFSVWVKAGTAKKVRFAFVGVTNFTSIYDLSSEWQKFSVTLTTAAGAMESYIQLGDVYVGAGNGGTAYVWGADLRFASTPSSIPYQRIAAATDYATGSAFPVYLAFDGSNDSLATNSIDFSATNKMFACASVTKLSNTAIGVVTELSADASGNAGSFYISAPDTVAPNYGWRCGGNIRPPSTTALTYSAPITNVVSGLFDISGDSLIGRINGAQVANNTADQGTGNFGNYPLYIGARAGTSLYFNGRIFDLLVCGALVDYTDVANTEYYMAGEAGLPRTLTYDYVTLDSGDQITTDSGDPIYDQITFT